LRAAGYISGTVVPMDGGRSLKAGG